MKLICVIETWIWSKRVLLFLLFSFPFPHIICCTLAYSSHIGPVFCHMAVFLMSVSLTFILFVTDCSLMLWFFSSSFVILSDHLDAYDFHVYQITIPVVVLYSFNRVIFILKLKSSLISVLLTQSNLVFTISLYFIYFWSFHLPN